MFSGRVSINRVDVFVVRNLNIWGYFFPGMRKDVTIYYVKVGAMPRIIIMSSSCGWRQREYSHKNEWDKPYRVFFLISHFQTGELENSQVCFSFSYISD